MLSQIIFVETKRRPEKRITQTLTFPLSRIVGR